jgi:hypothetical protein
VYPREIDLSQVAVGISPGTGAMGGSSTGANFNGSDTNWNTSEFPVFFNVPASKYPFSYTTGGSNVFLFGYEFNA